MMKNITCLRSLLFLLPMLGSTACTLPGLDPKIEGEESVATYQPPGKESGLVLNYEPVVERITPELILEQKRRKAGTRSVMPAALVQSGDGGSSSSAYRIGSGDVVAIIVFGHQDITNPAGTSQSLESSGRVVDRDGNIFVPFIGEMKVADKTVNEVRKDISAGLSEVIRDPQVDIRILNYRSKKVYITGDISRPCSVPIQDVRLTVVDALDACQSLISERDPGVSGVNAVQLIRDNTVYPLNLSLLYREGGEAITLQDGDRLIVDDGFNRIFLIGEFSNQTAAPYTAGGMTLSDAMIAAGGLNLETADAGGIYVIRGFVDDDLNSETDFQTNRRPHIYHLNARNMDALILADQFELKPRDVVFASAASLVNFNRALALIAPSVNLLFQSAIVYDRTTRDR